MGWSRTRIDDLDGSAARPYTLGIDGKAYVLDLGERNRKRIEDLLRPFLVVAQEYGQMPPPPEEESVPEVPALARTNGAAARPASAPRVPAKNANRKMGRTPATTTVKPTSKRTRAAEAAAANAKAPTKAASTRRRRNHPDGRPRDLASVRAWAQANGYALQGTGRIPNRVLEAYDTKTPAS